MLIIAAALSVILFIVGCILSYIQKENYNAVAGVILCISFLGLYYSLILWSLKNCGFFDFLARLGKKDILFSAFVFLGVMLFVIAEVGRDRFVYFWDYGGYWGVTIEQSRNFFLSPLQNLKDLYTSINTLEYNNIIPSLLALPMKIVGESFVSYTLLILIMFIFPMAAVLAFSLDKMLKKAEWKSLPFSLSLLLIFSLPMLFTPLFYGYLDAACLLSVAVLWATAISFEWSTFSWKKNFSMAFMLLFVVLQRRYFAFYAVGYVLTLSIPIIIQFIEQKSDRKKLIKNVCFNLLVIGVFCLTVLIVFFKGFLEQSIFNNFSLAYAAYSTGSFKDKFLDVEGSFGLFIYIIAAFGFLIGVFTKKLRGIALMLLVSFVVTQLLFFRIQSMGQHHLYLLYTQIILLVLIFVGYMYNFLLQRNAKYIVGAVFVILFVCNFSYTFKLIPYSKIADILYCTKFYQPKIRTDIPELQLMVNDLNKEASENNKHIYVVASSVILNDDILRKLYMPDIVNYMPNLESGSNVDLRDGFPSNFLTSDIVVVADPIQYHLRPENQQVVGVLAKEVMSGGKLAGNFKLTNEYTIDQGVKVKVYEKSKPFTQTQINDLQQEFDTLYPDFPDLFKNRITINQ